MVEGGKYAKNQTENHGNSGPSTEHHAGALLTRSGVLFNLYLSSLHTDVTEMSPSDTLQGAVDREQAWFAKLAKTTRFQVANQRLKPHSFRAWRFVRVPLWVKRAK